MKDINMSIVSETIIAKTSNFVLVKTTFIIDLKNIRLTNKYSHAHQNFN